jgi:uncharacterized glyoxalase superfamily protein PhnB
MSVKALQPDGTPGHTELRLGDSVIMLSEATASRPPTPVMLHVYVEDVAPDELQRRARAAKT